MLVLQTEDRKVELKNVLMASGACGYVGEKWFYDHFPPWRWNRDRIVGETTFITKTTPLEPRVGFTRLKEDGFTLRDIMPRSVIVHPWSGDVLNAFGLSSPGARRILTDARLRCRVEPFVFSFMAVGSSYEERRAEWAGFLTLLVDELPNFQTDVVVEIGLSCPNVGLDTAHLAEEAEEMLDLAQARRMPCLFMVNLNLLVPAKTAARISRHSWCAAISQCNTVPYGSFPDRIPWKKLYGSADPAESPLKRRGFAPGGLSSRRTRPILIDWIRDAGQEDIRAPLIVGGGMQTVEDVEEVFMAGHGIIDGIKFGVAKLVAPFEFLKMLDRANQWFSNIKPRKIAAKERR